VKTVAKVTPLSGIILVSPLSKPPKWWPEEKWVTIDPDNGGFVVGEEEKFHIDANEWWDMVKDWKRDHPKRHWRFKAKATVYMEL